MDSDTPLPGLGDVSVRAAAAADYDQIVAVVDEWWGRPIRAILPRLFLDHFHRTSFVAFDDRELAGFLIGFMSPSVHDEAYVHFVGVHPRFRGHGLARLLYVKFFDLAAANGRSVVRAITGPVNSGSIAFHKAMGFTVTGPIPDYDGPSADKMLFERQLVRSRRSGLVERVDPLGDPGGFARH